MFIHQIRETRPCCAIGGVNLDLIAGFCIFQSDDTDVRQNLFTFVMNVNSHEIVPPCADRERPRKIWCLKVRNEKNDCAARDDFIQIIERQRRFCPASSRFKKQNLADEPQGVRAAFLWRNKKFDPIGEENETDLVVIPDRAEREQTRDFRSQLALGLRNTSEIPGSADVDNEHDGKFTFLCKFFYKRGA